MRTVFSTVPEITCYYQVTVRPLVNAPLLVNVPVRSANGDLIEFLGALKKGGAVRKPLSDVGYMYRRRGLDDCFAVICVWLRETNQQ